MRFRWLLAVVLLALAGASTAGCVAYAYDYPIEAYREPPPPLVEYIPPAPGPDYVWISGYWWWNGRRYVWIPGHWARRPYPGYVWVRAGWVYRGGRYVFVPGFWVHVSRAPKYHYVHPAVPARRGKVYKAVPPRGKKKPRGRPAVTGPAPRGHPVEPASRD